VNATVEVAAVVVAVGAGAAGMMTAVAEGAEGEADAVAEVVAATDAMTVSLDKFLISVETQEKQSQVTENFSDLSINFQ
jgi:predicted flavoprotein YhiN